MPSSSIPPKKKRCHQAPIGSQPAAAGPRWWCRERAPTELVNPRYVLGLVALKLLGWTSGGRGLNPIVFQDFGAVADELPSLCIILAKFRALIGL